MNGLLPALLRDGLPRRVSPETLDHLAEDDPAAMRSRRDLRRVHLAMGTRRILVSGLSALADAGFHGSRRLRVLELGAGDGSLMLGVARALHGRWPPVALTLLDRQRLVEPAVLEAYAGFGWQARPQVQDALDWADEALPPTWDLIVTSLFLHHFEGPELGRLLAAIAARTDRFFACEPRRGWAALAGSHLIGAIGANAVTREDAVLSVHAGFRGHELGAAWLGAAPAWHLEEAAAGLFSHVFSAKRTAPASAAPPA